MRQDGAVWAEGPWEAVHPSADIDEVVDQLCPAIARQPLAAAGDYGQEYCGVLYRMPDGKYYASHAATLGKVLALGPSRKKLCRVPVEVRDGRGEPDLRADFHSHPWKGSPMSPQDLIAKNQVFSIRIQFDAGCRVLKYLPFLQDGSRAGELYERQGRVWRLVGRVRPENKAIGKVTEVVP
jgi:hypothetical protein